MPSFRKTRSPLALLFVLFLLPACSSTRPVLKANSRYQATGEARAQAAITTCMAEQPGNRDDAGEQALIVAAGTIAGAGTGALFGVRTAGDPDDIGSYAAGGAAVGAVVGFLWGLYMATESETRFRYGVEDCLRERGYAVDGWK